MAKCFVMCTAQPINGPSDHGEYDFHAGRCPRCAEVALLKLCVECEQHPGTIPFAESAMDMIHGGTRNICRCCYFERVRKAYVSTKENYEKLMAELAADPCAARYTTEGPDSK